MTEAALFPALQGHGLRLALAWQTVMLSYQREALLPQPFTPRLAASTGLATRSPAWGAERGMADVQTQQSSPGDVRRSAWMAAAQAGDRSAYEALLRDCVPIIQAIARRQGVPSDQVDDVVQEVLLSVHRARQTYDPARSFTAWLQVIAERRAIDHLRRASRQRSREIHAPLDYEGHADPAADPARGVRQTDVAARVDRALATLPKGQREAVKHLIIEERSLSDTAALTRRSEGALKVNLHRALKALRAKFGREE
jgi:RNA polymerase sigma-70 factor (ECF subfamily)